MTLSEPRVYILSEYVVSEKMFWHVQKCFDIPVQLYTVLEKADD